MTYNERQGTMDDGERQPGNDGGMKMKGAQTTEPCSVVWALGI